MSLPPASPAAASDEPLFGTETMAELYAAQGRVGDAIAILRGLMARSDDARACAAWTQRIATLERTQRHAEALPLRARGTAVGPRPAATRTAVAASDDGLRLPLLVAEAVRSGQTVHAHGRDLLVLGPVNPGAQLIADGHIHVYGGLRGRAHAGASGCADARVFCSHLHAELIMIADAFMTAEDLPTTLIGRPVQVQLRDGRCVVRPL